VNITCPRPGNPDLQYCTLLERAMRVGVESRMRAGLEVQSNNQVVNANERQTRR